jgi:hypothetical protein
MGSWRWSVLLVLWRASADVGGVGGPVAGGGTLPLDGDGDVEAEQAGEDRGGQFRGEGEQRGGAVLAGAEADAPEVLTEPVVADRLARTAARKQPGSRVRGADRGLAPPRGDQLKDEAGYRLGEHDRGRAQQELDTVAVGVDVVGGELADGGDALGVEDQQEPGDPVGGLQAGVVQEPARVGPALLGVQRAAGALPAVGAEGQPAGMAVGDGQRTKWLVSSR